MCETTGGVHSGRSGLRRSFRSRSLGICAFSGHTGPPSPPQWAGISVDLNFRKGAFVNSIGGAGCGQNLLWVFCGSTHGDEIVRHSGNQARHTFLWVRWNEKHRQTSGVYLYHRIRVYPGLTADQFEGERRVLHTIAELSSSRAVFSSGAPTGRLLA